MASTPTTKSQVQAYRFVLRRMESALVRKDAVMLHDPMRTHKRATVVGIIVGVVGLAGFAIVGFLSPSPSVPGPGGIVIAKNSGQMYVVQQNPHQLVPVFNLASARLLLDAEQQSQQQGQGGSAGGASSNQGTPQVQNPEVVDDSQLSGIPVGRLTGIPDGPQELPGPGSGTSDWAVCDDTQRDENATNHTLGQPVTTSVLAGVPNIGQQLPPGEALLATAPDNNTYLIYQRQSNVNDPNDSDVRARIDINDRAITSALHLTNHQPRQISAALLSAIPSVGDITNPVVNQPGLGQFPSSTDVGVKIGQAFRVQQADGSYNYYVMLQNGVEQVSETTAQIVRAETGLQADMPSVALAKMPGMTTLNNDPLNVKEYPGQLSDVIDADTEPLICLGWRADTSDQQKPQAYTRITIDKGYHLPVDSSTGQQMAMNKIGQANPDGQRIDDFFMDPKYQGITVRAAGSAGEFYNGPIELVSQRGLVYSIQDLRTAQVLGVAGGGTTPPWGMSPAPQAILQLLPTSAQTLNDQNVQHTYDSLPLPASAGVYMTPPNGQQQQQSSGG